MSTPDPSQLPAEHAPLLSADPVQIGPFWLDTRLAETPAGVVYCAHQPESDSVMVVMLNDGAASDPAARARFSGEIDAMHIDTVIARGGQDQNSGRLAVRFHDDNDDPVLASHRPLAPWVALAFDGSRTAVAEGVRILSAVDLIPVPQLGKPSGPDYHMHWWSNTGTGTWRTWPLAWPGRKDRAGWISLLVSFLIMLLISALAVLLAILVFQNQPPVSPPAPVPTSATATETQSSTPSGSEEVEPSRTDSPSMQQPSDGQSGDGAPSPERKL